MSEILPPEQARELASAPDIEEPGTMRVFDVPCTIYVEGREQPFVVHAIKSWQLTQLGFFVSGHWADEPDTERDLLIPPTRIVYTDIDFAAYEAATGDVPEDAEAA